MFNYAHHLQGSTFFVQLYLKCHYKGNFFFNFPCFTLPDANVTAARFFAPDCPSVRARVHVNVRHNSHSFVRASVCSCVRRSGRVPCCSCVRSLVSLFLYPIVLAFVLVPDCSCVRLIVHLLARGSVCSFVHSIHSSAR